MPAALIRPRLLRAFARLAIAVFCVHAAQPVVASLPAVSSSPATLVLCTAAGPRIVAPDGSSAPFERPETKAGGHCVFCFAWSAAPPPAAGMEAPFGLAEAPVRAGTPQSVSSDGLRCPDARGPPHARKT